MSDSSDSDDDSVFNQPLPFARQSQSLTSVGDDRGDGDGDGGGNGSTLLSQPMADAAMGSNSSSDNNGGDATDVVAASGSDCSPTPKKRARRGADDEVDEDVVARRANQRINHVELSVTDKRTLTSPSQLFWCVTNKKGGKGKLYYACRVADHPDQYKGLDLAHLKEGEVCVQYFDYAGGACTLKNYGNVRRSKLVPFYGSTDVEVVDLKTVSWCPDLCALYEKQLQKELKSKMADAEKRAVQIRVHLLFLSMALEHARAQEAETKRLKASHKKNVKRSRPTGCMSSNDIDAALADNEATDGSDASPEGDDGNADDSDEDSLDPANKKRKTETLRPGDVIEFYHMMAVHGRKEALCEAKIISVDPRKAAVLALETGDFLLKDHQIRRIKKIHRGKLIDCNKANFQPIANFRLSKATLKGIDENKIYTAAYAKEAERVGEIVNRNMRKFQEKAQADGFAPLDLMVKYKGTNFNDDSKTAAAGADGTMVDLLEDINAASSEQRQLRQTINSAADKPSAEAQRNDGDDDAEKKTEDWTEI